MTEHDVFGKWRCVHYLPPTEAFTCAAGVSWESLGAIKSDERPCYLTAAGVPRPWARDCEHRKLPLSMQSARNAIYWDSKFATTLKAAEAIADVKRAHKGKHVAQIVQCPVCKGSLHVTVFVNGRASGNCDSKDCVRWIE